MNFSPFLVLAVDLLFLAGREDLCLPNIFAVQIDQVMLRSSSARFKLK